MTTYARIVNGLMVERIDPFFDANGKEVPIEQRFHPDFISQLTEIDPNNPPATEKPPAPPQDWRPAAVTALYIQRKARMDVLTAMQSDYSALGQVDNAAACLEIKQALKNIDSDATVMAVYNDPAATASQYTAAVKAKWDVMVAPIPAQVKMDFVKYGGNTT